MAQHSQGWCFAGFFVHFQPRHPSTCRDCAYDVDLVTTIDTEAIQYDKIKPLVKRSGVVVSADYLTRPLLHIDAVSQLGTASVQVTTRCQRPQPKHMCTL